MIRDRDFKLLNHSYKNYKKYLSGESLEEGYKPDYVLRNGNDYLILESENSSSRKTFVGGMIKAAHFLQGERKGKLVFIIVPKKNTKASSIAKHLKPYFGWIRDKTNLEEVYVIEALQYYNNEVLMPLDCKQFGVCAYKV